MPRWKRLPWPAAAACAVLVLLASPVRAAGPAEPGTLSLVDRYLADERAATGIPGLALVVVQGDRIVHLTAQGTADASGRAITPQTPFLLASVSKSFTAIAVMGLVEAGRLDLDASVRRYLPWFTLADPASAEITLRQLLNHTSGLAPEADAIALDTEDQDVGALERTVRALAKTRPVSPPGAEYHYTNSGYDVLSLIIQAVSGEPFSDYVERHVFGPLDMRHSHATLAGAHADGVAAGYQLWFGLAWLPTAAPISRSWTASGSMFASAEDVGHALIAQLNGGAYGGSQVLSPAGVTVLQTPTAKIDGLRGYAMGWWTRPLADALDAPSPDPGPATGGAQLIEHTGHWNNANTYVGFVPSQGWGMALLINANDRSGASRLDLLSQNTLRLIKEHGIQPWVVREDLLTRYAVVAALGVLAMELASLGWSLRMVRRAGRRGKAASRQLILGGALALSIDGFVVLLVAFLVPRLFDATLYFMVRAHPDLVVIVAPAVALALVWGPCRSLLFVRQARMRSASPIPERA